MKIELFINFDSESLTFCEQIRGINKSTQFSRNPMMFSKKLRFYQLAPWVG